MERKGDGGHRLDPLVDMSEDFESLRQPGRFLEDVKKIKLKNSH